MSCLLLLLLLQPLGEDASTLVRRLGDESFAVRREALQALKHLGSVAVPAVRDGLKHKDPEVRRLCAQWLEEMAREQRAVRAAAFLADSGGKISLSGWERFRATTPEPAARELFAAVYRIVGNLLDVEGNPRAVHKGLLDYARSLETACLELDRGSPTLAEVVALVFVASDPRIERDPQFRQLLTAAFTSFAYRPRLLKEFANHPTASAHLLAFLQSCQDNTTLPLALELARQLDVKSYAEQALRMALDAQRPSSLRSTALLLLARIGDRSLTARLEPLLEVRTSVGTFTLRKTALTAQIRDVALAVLVRWSEHPLADYGFPYAQAIPGLKDLPSAERLGFADETTRQKAIAKWRKSSPSSPRP